MIGESPTRPQRLLVHSAGRSARGELPWLSSATAPTVPKALRLVIAHAVLRASSFSVFCNCFHR